MRARITVTVRISVTVHSIDIRRTFPAGHAAASGGRVKCTVTVILISSGRSRAVDNVMPGKPHPSQISFRTEVSQYYIWGGIGLVLIFVGIKNTVENPSHWYSLMFLTLAWIILFSWLAAYKICIEQDVLSYSAFLKGTVSVNRDDIAKAEVLSGRFAHAIIIELTSGYRIVINTKPFKKSDLQILLQFLANKIVHKSDFA
jgi:hypothetical protein